MEVHSLELTGVCLFPFNPSPREGGRKNYSKDLKGKHGQPKYPTEEWGRKMYGNGVIKKQKFLKSMKIEDFFQFGDETYY